MLYLILSDFLRLFPVPILHLQSTQADNNYYFCRADSVLIKPHSLVVTQTSYYLQDELTWVARGGVL